MQGQGLLGAIEGGGTKFVCAIGATPGVLLGRVEIPTTDAVATLRACVAFFQAAQLHHGPLRALGVGCFGPLQLQPEARDYGCLLGTPKPGWSGASVLAPLREALQVPVVLDTDVGAASRGELELGAGQGLGSLAYVTVGTGIGGAVAPAAPGIHLMHAEMGHLAVRRDARDTEFAGTCPFHGDCLEGLASGPAVRARWGCDLHSLPAAHPGRDIIAGYLAQLAAAITLLHAPQKLVLGGGVMSDGTLLPRVRAATHALLAGYLSPLRDAGDIESYIRPPGLGGNAAIAGAMLMAEQALRPASASG